MSDDCIDDVGVTQDVTEVTSTEDTPVEVTISEETTTLAISCDEIVVEPTNELFTVDTYDEVVTVDVTDEVITVTTDCAQGPQGPPGSTTWNDEQTYEIGHIVYYDGNFYVALTENTNSTPDTNPADWDQITTGGGGAVDSVNGETGVVVLDAGDVGADVAGAATQALTDANNYTDTEIAALAFLESIQAGDFITVDDTDPQNPIVSSTQNYTQFVFDSTAIQAGNVYNNWSDLVTDINNGQSGQKTITFRTNGDTLPAGTWNLSNTTFSGNGFPPVAGGITINLADGFKFAPVPNLTFDRFIGFNSQSTQPIFEISGLSTIFMKENAVFSSENVPFFQVNNGAFAFFIVNIGSIFTASAAPVLDVKAGANVILPIIGSAVELDTNSIVGDVGATMQFINFALAPNNDYYYQNYPEFLGTLNKGLSTRADYLKFDNVVSGLTAVQVQAAIDELVTIIPDIPDGTMVNDVPTWDGTEYVPMPIVEKTTTLFDETTTPGVIYIGKAQPTGAAISEAGAVWAIKTIDTTADTEIKWADGVTTYTKVWDNRASYSYF